MADTSPNDNRIGLLIWKISNLWQSKIRFLLKEYDLTVNEYLILETLFKIQMTNNNISQQDICKNSSIDRAVVSLKITKLEKKNLILKIDPIDKRSDSLQLTNEGKSLISGIINSIENEEQLIFEKLGNEIFNFTNSLKLLLGKKIRIRAK
tara:strand:- start:179 stop:631 length:453 start_codon:yes stop_codon:yes gene_type:complete